MNHSLTYFHRVRLPYSALLGGPEKPDDPKMAFFHNISRVAVGTIAIGSLGVPALQVASYIAAKYSLRRTVVGNGGRRQPIMDFRTQKTPIVTAVAQSFVMQALHARAVSLFRDVKLDYRVRHAVASILKVVMIQHAQAAHLTLGDRCGAQGLFEVNQLTAMHVSWRLSALYPGLTGTLRQICGGRPSLRVTCLEFPSVCHIVTFELKTDQHSLARLRDGATLTSLRCPRHH